MDTRGNTGGKEALREGMKRRLKALDAGERKDWSRAINGFLAEVEPGRKRVAFMPLDSEPDILPSIERIWCAGDTVVLPRVEGGSLVLHEVAGMDQLVRGAFGIWEPRATLPCWTPGPSLCLVPGLAFDARGYRLGRGKGFYDRLLQGLGTAVETVGIFFSCQEISAVPRETHDWPLGRILTEKGWRQAVRP